MDEDSSGIRVAYDTHAIDHKLVLFIYKKNCELS